MIPPFLKKGDKVALVAPAGRVAEAEVQQAAAILQSWGLVAVAMPHIAEEYGCFAGRPEQRLCDLQQAFDDADTKAVFCARGGYGLVQIVGGIDWSGFLSHPKWIVGYSDVTVLHNAVCAHGVASMHAPMLRNLARAELPDTLLETYRKMLFGDLPSYKRKPHPLNRYGKTQGKIVGGNLAVFSALRGTPLDLDFADKILFIEDIGEKPHCVERMLWNLKLAGVFDRIRGLIVGQFTDYEEDNGLCRTLPELIADVVADYRFPVVFDFPSGHIRNNHPLLFNYDCRLEVNALGVQLDFSK